MRFGKMGYHAGMFLLVLFLGLLTSFQAQAQAPASVEGGAGFRTFDGKKYYYNASGKLVRNQIIKANGKYHYVDANGEKNNDPVIKLAVKFVTKNARKNGTRKQKLRDCYKKLVSYRYVRYFKGKSKKASEKNNRALATAMFRNKQGYCYKYAAAMSYCATVLGYKTRFVSGAFLRKIYDHGWCEVKIGNEWRILDCSRQRHHTQDLFLAKKVPYKLIRFENYELIPSGGKAVWKRVWKKGGK